MSLAPNGAKTSFGVHVKIVTTAGFPVAQAKCALPLSGAITRLALEKTSINSIISVFPAKFKNFPPLIYSISSLSFGPPVKTRLQELAKLSTTIFQLSRFQCLFTQVVAGAITTSGFDLSKPDKSSLTFSICSSLLVGNETLIDSGFMPK